jgi:hypothetical protein
VAAAAPAAGNEDADEWQQMKIVIELRTACTAEHLQ